MFYTLATNHNYPIYVEAGRFFRKNKCDKNGLQVLLNPLIAQIMIRLHGMIHPYIILSSFRGYLSYFKNAIKKSYNYSILRRFLFIIINSDSIQKVMKGNKIRPKSKVQQETDKYFKELKVGNVRER